MKENGLAAPHLCQFFLANFGPVSEIWFSGWGEPFMMFCHLTSNQSDAAQNQNNALFKAEATSSKEVEIMNQPSKGGLFGNAKHI